MRIHLNRRKSGLKELSIKTWRPFQGGMPLLLWAGRGFNPCISDARNVLFFRWRIEDYSLFRDYACCYQLVESYCTTRIFWRRGRNFIQNWGFAEVCDSYVCTQRVKKWQQQNKEWRIKQTKRLNTNLPLLTKNTFWKIKMWNESKQGKNQTDRYDNTFMGLSTK